MRAEVIPAANLTWKTSRGEYSCRLDIANSRRLKNAGYDLSNAKQLGELFADPYDALDFFASYLRPLWEEAGLAELDFLELATEDDTSLDRLFDAITAGLLDFFLRCRDERRAKIVRKAREAVARANEKILAKLDDPKVDQAIDGEIARVLDKIDAQLDAAISGETSTDSPANSESTPADSPSAN